MAETNKSALRIARENAGYSRAAAADLLAVHPDTVRRWEDPMDSTTPRSADVSRMEDTYRCPGLWYKWMYSNDDGFRDRMPPPGETDVRGTVLSLYAAVSRLVEEQAKLMRDAADGSIDDPALAKRIRTVSGDAIAAAQSLMNALKE